MELIILIGGWDTHNKGSREMYGVAESAKCWQECRGCGGNEIRETSESWHFSTDMKEDGES